jgi:acetylglutamate kinase
VESTFVDGLRVTDAATVEIAEMVLAGAINKRIVSAINAQGGRGVGLSGKDANLMVCEKLTRTKRDAGSAIEQVVDLGFVGEPRQINVSLIETLVRDEFIPVIAPIGVGRQGETYNVNADTAAGAVAGALKAARLLLLTDVAGVKDADGDVVTELRAEDCAKLIAQGVIAGGMIPKVQTALDAVNGGVNAAVILDGRAPHACLLELFTSHGAGTILRR